MTNEEFIEKAQDNLTIADIAGEIYNQNILLIRKIIKPYTKYAEENDLLQEAYLGLCDAVQNYDTSKNVKFMSYAGFWIKQAAQRYIDNNISTIRIPSYMENRIQKYKRICNEFERDNGREAKDSEISKLMLLPLSAIRDIKRYMLNIVSLDAPLKEDSDLNALDLIDSHLDIENDVVDNLFMDYEEKALWEIVERYTSDEQKKVLYLYYKDNKTLKEISKQVGKSVEYVRNKRDSGLKRLRKEEAKIEIEEKLDIVNASLYRSGLKKFKEHNTSVVEYIAIKKIGLDQKRERI